MLKRLFKRDNNNNSNSIFFLTILYVFVLSFVNCNEFVKKYKRFDNNKIKLEPADLNITRYPGIYKSLITVLF
jgi:hypothetical protein